MARPADCAGRAGSKVTQMQSAQSAGITFINAQLSGGEFSSMRILGPCIAAFGENPHPGDSIVDLQGDRVLPGLINAHDHLQLNSLPRQESGKRYRHVREWISDVDASRRSDPAFEASVAMPGDERLLIGGVKNLLSGVTTVAHHDPFYAFLSNAHYPTQVVRDYGWSHSLYVDGEEKVSNSYRRTPIEWPWIIHAAEGLNEEASNEFERLDALGCIGPNTLLVHGIALDQAQRMRLTRADAGLIWCPSSNLSLFGKTAEVLDLVEHGRVALGTDSRLSGARDLLDELHIVGQISGLDDPSLESLVTSHSARLLRLSDRGALRVGARADVLILPAGTRLAAANRADVRLVLIDGSVRFGDRDYAQSVAPSSQWADIRVDGKPKILDIHIAALLTQARTSETGLDLQSLTWRAA
jgi:cytosine/adenosine deaminase-related metal-dependent hydrolase